MSGRELDAFAARLRAVWPDVAAPAAVETAVMRRIHREIAFRRFAKRLPAVFGLAAAIALAAGGVWHDSCRTAPRGAGALYMNAYATLDESAAKLPQSIENIVNTQKEDGSWAHPRLSACNVAALAAARERGFCTDESLRAWKKGVRYLRMNGINELTSAQFAAEAKSVI